MININKVQQRINEHYDIVKNKGYEIIGVFLQGSQNYELEYENSDIDSKVIVIPSFNDFVLNKPPVSIKITLDNNEQIDIKDIRVMFNLFKKQNISFVEILFAKYKKINNKYQQLIDVKRGIYNLNEARNIAKKTTDEVIAMKNKYIKHNELIINQKVENILNTTLVDIIKDSFRLELKIS